MVPFEASSDFDPRRIDLQYIKTISDCMPRDGRLDINQAEILATKTLRGADYCIDLVAQASHWCELKESEKNEAKATAIAKLIDRGASATTAAQQYSNDPDYTSKCKDFALAKAWYEWIDLKHRHLMAAHVHCKDVMKRNITHEHSSGFKSDGSLDEDTEQFADTKQSHKHSDNAESDARKIGAENW